MSYTDISPSSSASIPYATPSASKPASRTAVGVWIAIFGLALIVIGGCFLIGIWMMVEPKFVALSGPFAPVNNPTTSATFGWVFLMIVLYFMAFICFAGAAYLLSLGVRILLTLTKARV